MAPKSRREVVLVVYDGVVMLDVAGPLQVLNGAGDYRIRLASPDGRPAHTDVGVRIDVELALPDIHTAVDTLLVPGRPTRAASGPPPILVEQVRRIARRTRRVAKYLVVFLQRPGGQAQFDIPGARPAPRDAVMHRVLDAVLAQPSGEHNLATMAARASVSERHLTRLFRRELDATPARYVEQVRVWTAQALLETGNAGITAIARTCGFGSAQTMRRAFQRVAGVTPAAYRRRFRAQRL